MKGLAMKKIVSLLFGISAIALCAEVAPVITFDFEKFENGKIYSADKKYTGTVRNPEAVKQTEGKIGKALNFQGKFKGNKAGAILVRNFKFDFTKPFTIEAMVKFDAKISHKSQRELFNVADGERGPGVRVALYYNSISLRSGDGKKIFTVGTSQNRTAVSVEEWHLLTMTYDGKTLYAYLDGVLSAQRDIAIKNPVKNRAMTIGSYKNGFSYPLRGDLDDLKFYDVCKTPAQVAEKYISIFGE